MAGLPNHCGAPANHAACQSGIAVNPSSEPWVPGGPLADQTQILSNCICPTFRLAGRRNKQKERQRRATSSKEAYVNPVIDAHAHFLPSGAIKASKTGELWQGLRIEVAANSAAGVTRVSARPTTEAERTFRRIPEYFQTPEQRLAV